MSVPERLGKYEIRSVLGKGAMGVVYKGFDPHIEREVALKTVRKDIMDPELVLQFMARFKNEAKAVGRLHHPNIVDIYEFGEDESVAFIAMEYVEGTGLAEHLNRATRFEFAQLARIVDQLLLALDYAHARGVIHRDVKPANLILTADGQVKLADFGIARIDTSEMTLAGAVLGTPSYMSPEQCLGETIDHRSDLFSVGVVLYEMLTCEKPFTGTVDTVMFKICHQEPRPPSQIAEGTFPAAVDALLAKALAKAPDARFRSAQEFRQALLQAAGLAAPSTASTEATVVADRSRVQSPPKTAWTEAQLSAAEKLLAHFVGPLAKVYVRKAAAQGGDLAALYAKLGAYIADPQERRRFITQAESAQSGTAVGKADVHDGTRGDLGSTPVSASLALPAEGTGAGAQVGGLDQSFIDATAARLAVFLGPIARIVTKKAAARATSREDFVQIVAGHVGTQDRYAFLRAMGMSETLGTS